MNNLMPQPKREALRQNLRLFDSGGIESTYNWEQDKCVMMVDQFQKNPM